MSSRDSSEDKNIVTRPLHHAEASFFYSQIFFLKSYYQHILKKFHCLLQLNSMNRRNNFHIAATKSLPYQRI